MSRTTPSIVNNGKIAEVIPIKLIVFWKRQRLAGHPGSMEFESIDIAASRGKYTAQFISRLQQIEVSFHPHDEKQDSITTVVPMHNVQSWQAA